MGEKKKAKNFIGTKKTEPIEPLGASGAMFPYLAGMEGRGVKGTGLARHGQVPGEEKNGLLAHDESTRPKKEKVKECLRENETSKERSTSGGLHV